MQGRKRIYGPKVQKTTQKKYRKIVQGPVRSIKPKSMQRRPLDNAMASSMHYLTTADLNPGIGGAGASYVFRLSSLFDPDFTGVGHQPLGFDQISPLFERYQVWKVDFHVEFTNRDNGNPMRVGYRVSDQSTTSVDPLVNIENGNCEWALLGTSDGMGTKCFEGSVNVADVHGISYKQYMANDDYGAAVTTNPVEEAYMILFADGLGVDTGATAFSVHLVYHAKFMGPVLTSTS